MSMGQIFAILSKINEDVSATLNKIIESTFSATTDALGFSSNGNVTISNSNSYINGLKSNLLLGYKFTKILPNDLPQPISQNGYSMVFEGRIWEDNKVTDPFSIAEILGNKPIRSIRKLSRLVDGSYTLVIENGENLFCFRDPIGVVPIYYGENQIFAAIATNKKFLWAIGINPKILSPGYLIRITKNGICFEQVYEIKFPSVNNITIGKAIQRLDYLLNEATKLQSLGVNRASLGFSGGIDSTIIAHYLKKTGIDLELICVGIKDAYDFKKAETAADDLGLPILLESFTKEDVVKELNNVLWSVEEPNPMKIGVATPLFFACKVAFENGNRVFFSGNGADELFGGYQKYVNKYFSAGLKSVKNEIFKDVISSHKVNFDRDYKVCSDHGLELRLPFTDLNLINFALSLPFEFKISILPNIIRKRILRSLAKKLGFSNEIIDRPKKAIQYSTGVNKILKKIAKNNNKKLSTYLADKFMLLKKDYLKKVLRK